MNAKAIVFIVVLLLIGGGLWFFSVSQKQSDDEGVARQVQNDSRNVEAQVTKEVLENAAYVDFDLAVGAILEESISMSPNKQFALFTTAQGGGTGLFVYVVATDEAHPITGIQGEDRKAVWSPNNTLEVEATSVFSCIDDPDNCVPNMYRSVSEFTPWVVDQVSS